MLLELRRVRWASNLFDFSIGLVAEKLAVSIPCLVHFTG